MLYYLSRRGPLNKYMNKAKPFPPAVQIDKNLPTAAQLEVDEPVTLSSTFDKICEALEGLSCYISTANERADPENYSGFLALMSTDLDTAWRDYYRPGIEIKISAKTFAKARQWNNGALPQLELKRIQERVAAFNAGKLVTVSFIERPQVPEVYFSDPKKANEYLTDSYRAAPEEAGAARGTDDKGAGQRAQPGRE